MRLHGQQSMSFFDKREGLFEYSRRSITVSEKSVCVHKCCAGCTKGVKTKRKGKRSVVRKRDQELYIVRGHTELRLMLMTLSKFRRRG